MSRRRTALLGGLVALGVALAAACGGGGGSKSTTVQSGPVKIVVEGPMSGDQAATGTDMYRAARLAVDRANAGGGVLGHRIELIKGDDRADPEVGKEVEKRAVDDKAFAVIGPYNSSVGVENLKSYVDAGIIPIHLTSNAATDGLGYTIRPKDSQVAPVEAKAITGFLEAQTVAIVYDASSDTAGIAEQVKQALTKAGAKVVLYESFPEGKLDAAAVVGKIAAANPDLYYASTYSSEGGKIAEEAEARGVGPFATCLMGPANQDTKFAQVAGLGAALLCYSTGVPTAEQFRGAHAYVRQYRKRFGTAPGTWGTFTYDSAELLFSAVRKAGGWNRDRVNAQLAKTTNYRGITGKIDIDPKTGNRKVVPVVILDTDRNGAYIVDRKWARFAGFSQ